MAIYTLFVWVRGCNRKQHSIYVYLYNTCDTAKEGNGGAKSRRDSEGINIINGDVYSGISIVLL